MARSVGEPAPANTNTYSIVALACALFGISVLAIVFGHLALRQISASGIQRGRGLAIAAVSLGYLELVMLLFLAQKLV